MDANQVGYVHELSFDDVRKILDDSLSIQPGGRCRCSSPAASRR